VLPPPSFVIPVKKNGDPELPGRWIPACAGMTDKGLKIILQQAMKM